MADTPDPGCVETTSLILGWSLLVVLAALLAAAPELSDALDVSSQFRTPAVTYQDAEPMLVLSDFESSFKAFRDFLIAHQVIDTSLNWTFGRGHLVLVGDFVDRDVSTTQLLWLIYQLAQRASAVGCHVHFILGNHEIKNLQGDFQSAAKKYLFVATLLGQSQAALFGDNALLGRWLASKNSLELINDHLFVHGGLHSKLAEMDLNLLQLNDQLRSHYRHGYYLKPAQGDEEYLCSTRLGPSWYRGSIPPRSSEGLLIRNGQYFRLTEDGHQHSL